MYARDFDTLIKFLSFLILSYAEEMIINSISNILENWKINKEMDA